MKGFRDLTGCYFAYGHVGRAFGKMVAPASGRKSITERNKSLDFNAETMDAGTVEAAAFVQVPGCSAGGQVEVAIIRTLRR